MRNFVVFLYLLLSSNAWATDIVVGQTEKEKYRYRIELANLILEKTASQFGPAQIIPYGEHDPTQARAIALLNQEKLDLLFLPATEDRLNKFSSIKIDIHNGMLGYRVLLIRKNNQAQFAKVKTLDDLRKFKAGFGIQWGDFKVFALNNLPVNGISNTKTLHKMLDKERFDYFHRGLHEAWAEIETNREALPELMVEETIALVYDLPVYFMFNKNNKALKKRFETGLEMIKKDGSFKALFIEHFADIAIKADLENRTIIPIKYPNPKGLPAIDTSFWLDK